MLTHFQNPGLRFLISIALLFIIVPLVAQESVAQEICGLHVTPHQFSSEMRWRRPPNPELSAKVELFVLNNEGSALSLANDVPILFDGHTPADLLTEDQWAWHDTPAVRLTEDNSLPPNSLTVLTFNGKSAVWGTGTNHVLSIGSLADREFAITQPQAWLSSVTFLHEKSDSDSHASVYPNRIYVHITNMSGADLQIRSLQLWLPRPDANHHALYPARTFDELACFPNGGVVPAKGKGGFSVACESLPLTYTAIEVRVQCPDGTEESLWAHVRIKRDVFDVSGGWVASEVGDRNSLMIDEYLQTLKRMHINTGQIQDVSGFTDDPQRYAVLPLKRFNRLWPLSRYDTDNMLPTIHAVEFIGEPQYGGGRPVPPQEVWEKFAPYQPSRLPTSVTLSEEHSWRYYAGLSDFPHFDAYRVTAPAADSWGGYDRWSGQQIRWGAPLETIGTMTRSLRDLNRPRPIAYWAQGAHHDWGSRRSSRRGSPTPDELRSQAWQGLANRITSLYWFNLSVKSLGKFPDLIEPITRVNREVRMLESLFLTGDAFEYRREVSNDKPDWDLNSIANADTILMIAHDLTYQPDATSNEFTFVTRAGTFSFRLPHWLQQPSLSVFGVDADGTHDIKYVTTDSDITVTDPVRVVGIYLATIDQSLRARIDGTHRQLLQSEAACTFDPAHNAEHLKTLRELAAQ